MSQGFVTVNFMENVYLTNLLLTKLFTFIINNLKLCNSNKI